MCNSAHAVVIVGYAEGPLGQFLYIADPDSSPPDNVSLVSYSNFTKLIVGIC